jgi:hypothetical protein
VVFLSADNTLTQGGIYRIFWNMSIPHKPYIYTYLPCLTLSTLMLTHSTPKPMILCFKYIFFIYRFHDILLYLYFRVEMSLVNLKYVFDGL